MPSDPATSTPPRPARWRHALAVAGLAALVLVAHGGALRDGVYYDDHWHRARLRSCGWGLADLVEATTFDFPGRLIHLWWQDRPLQWRYPRPVAMFFMKLEYTLAGGDPRLIHACGLVWHGLCAGLVYALACWVLGSTGWALLAAGLFALQPNGAFAVSWSAARNALVGAFFLLAAVLAYLAASRPGRPTAAPLRPGWLALSGALWVLALCARETAIIFPLLAAGLDACFGGRRQLARRLPVYGLLGLLAGAYVAWRLWVFPVAAAPQLYFRTPEGPGYVWFAASRLLQLVFGLLVHLPLFTAFDPLEGPAGRVLFGHAVMLAVVGGGLVLYLGVTRGAPGRWAWPLWVVAGLAPVVPVATMPHFGYLPFVGCALGGALLLARLPRRWRRVLVPLSLALVAGALAGHRVLWRGAFRAEQLIYADIRAGTPRPPPGSTLVFINLPTSATFAAAALREAWGVDELEAHVLTLAPEPFRMPRASTVEQVGDRELVVSTPPPGYFGGYLERKFLALARAGPPPTAGCTVPGPLFDTTVLETTEAGGLLRLRFRFHEPLDRPGLYIYASTPARPAGRLRFDGGSAAQDPAVDFAHWQAEHAAALAERDRFLRLVDLFTWD